MITLGLWLVATGIVAVSFESFCGRCMRRREPLPAMEAQSALGAATIAALLQTAENERTLRFTAPARPSIGEAGMWTRLQNCPSKHFVRH